jgi:hypothetical protein
MTNTPITTDPEPVQEESNEKPNPSFYAESVKMTPQRLMNAVIKNQEQQGGLKGVRDE